MQGFSETGTPADATLVPVVQENASPSDPVNPPQEVFGEETGSFDFDAFVNDADDDLLGTEEETPAPQKITEPAKEEPAPVEAEPRVEEAPAAATPVTTPEPTPAPEALAAPAAQPDPVDLNAQYEQFFNSSVEALRDQVYSLSDEAKEAIDSNPSKIIPEMLARVHMQVLTAAVTQVASMLPQMLPAIQERTTLEQQNEQKFFEKFPALRNRQDDVVRIAKAYKSANPGVPVDQAINEIGTMASIALRLPIPTVSQPTAPVVPGPVVPTSARGSAPAPQPTNQKTVWDEIIEEDND